MYLHMNNSIYYQLFDLIVNIYLIERCGFTPPSSPLIGLVVSSHCQVRYSEPSLNLLISMIAMIVFSPLGFPQVIDLGLRVNKLGTSSVIYEVGFFEEGKDTPAAVGGYAQVFVESESRKSTAFGPETRDDLQKLFVPQTKL